jgi:hypothetical protein
VSDKRSIEAAFARANVPLEITSRSLNRRLVGSGGQMVQMSISASGDSILMNIPDGEDIDVRALGADPEHQQVVMMVHEPERKFVEKVWNRGTHKFEDATRKVPGGKRRFLVGMDECHLFIAQMGNRAKATSVKQAHEGLRPADLPTGRKAKKQKIKRTGEWFLIPATSQEVKEIEDYTKKFGIRKKVGIGTSGGSVMRGRPHIVSESVVIARRTRTEGPTTGQHRIVVVRSGTEFIRGRIIHPDHKVVKLKTWHRVMMNSENRNVGSQWVD